MDSFGLSRKRDFHYLSIDDQKAIVDFCKEAAKENLEVSIQIEADEDDFYLYGLYSKTLEEVANYYSSGGIWGYSDPIVLLKALGIGDGEGFDFERLPSKELFDKIPYEDKVGLHNYCKNAYLAGYRVFITIEELDEEPFFKYEFFSKHQDDVDPYIAMGGKDPFIEPVVLMAGWGHDIDGDEFFEHPIE